MNDLPLKIMALDVGDRTIGVAVGDDLGIAAHPVETIRRTRPPADIRRVLELVAERRITRILVGHPRMLNGTIGIQADKVEAFVEHLREATPLPIILWDERFSTTAAERTLIESGLTRAKRKKVIDQAAAMFFLQGYLDHLSLGGSAD